MVMFDTLPLRKELLEALDILEFKSMTPIQASSLPVMLTGKDVTGQAKTGSGKTAAFGLSLLNCIDTSKPATQALVLCPTRELADQVSNALRGLAKRMSHTRVLTLCGGRSYRDQALALEHGNHVVVGTPGRLNKHLRKGSLKLHNLKVLVFDEADRLLDMGFFEQVLDIIDHCPPGRQTLFFSATFSEETEALSAQVQRDPERVKVASQVEASLLQQQVFLCEAGERRRLLVDVLSNFRPQNALLFCETRVECRQIAEFLRGRGAAALALHGELEQRDRDEVLIQFANGSASILVATNVAARGLDIPSLPMVIITELSREPDSHLHRIGRTGRAGESGMALSLVEPNERNRLKRLESYMGQSIERAKVLHTDGNLDFLRPTHRTLLLLAGRRDKLRKGDVLGALVKDGQIPPEAIGRIDLMPRRCAVSIANAYALKALSYVETGTIKRKQLKARLLGHQPR